MSIKAVVENGIITITMPFDAEGTLSGSGKNTVHASTRGNADVVVGDQVMKLGVNLYKKVAK